jgi:hypothetical protein
VPGWGIDIATDDCLRGAGSGFAEMASKLVGAGVTPDEIRAFLKLPPLPHGTGARAWMPVNMAFADQPAVPEPAVAPPPSGSPLATVAHPWRSPTRLKRRRVAFPRRGRDAPWPARHQTPAGRP